MTEIYKIAGESAATYYNVAFEKCDAVTGQTKDRCVVSEKRRTANKTGVKPVK